MVRDNVESLEAEHAVKKPLSVRVVPSDVVLWGKNASQRFLVQGTFADGLERDITHLSRFSISDSAIVKIDERGRVKALANGEVSLKVEVAGQVVRSKVRVEGSQETKPFSFARDIGGIFTKKGCNSSDCHGSVKGKGGLKLSTNALYPRDDHKWITREVPYQVLTSEAAGQKIPRVDLKIRRIVFYCRSRRLLCRMEEVRFCRWVRPTMKPFCNGFEAGLLMVRRGEKRCV
jgi:hypothetical protein